MQIGLDRQKYIQACFGAIGINLGQKHVKVQKDDGSLTN